MTRYVCAEILKVFLTALGALTVMFILIGLVREARDQGLNPAQVVQIIPFILPDALRYTVPATALFAAASVYGRMSGTNEVVALKSLGISPLAILWPAVALASMLSVATVWLNDVAVSWGRAGVRRVVIESVEEIVYSMLRTQRSYKSNRFSIFVMDVRDDVLVQPMIIFSAQGNTPAVTLTAETAQLRGDAAAGILSIRCTNGSLDVEGQGRLRFTDTIERQIPLDQASRDGGGALLPSAMAMRDIPDQIVEQQRTITDLEQKLAALAGHQMMSGDFVGLSGAEWKVRMEDLKFQRGHLYRLKTEPHRRWSNGFSCLCFVLIGAPTAIRLRNSDFLTSFFACFVPILAIYYPLLIFGVDQAKSGSLPPWSVWLGNVILVAAGAYQWRMVRRY